MIKRIDKYLWQKALSDKKLLKALSFSILIKTTYRSSRVNNFSYLSVSKKFNIHRSTLKTYINTLKQYNLIEFEDNSLVFKRITYDSSYTNNKGEHYDFNKYMRNAYSIDIISIVRRVKEIAKNESSKQRKTNKIQFIADSLKAMVIVDIQNHKDYVANQLLRASNPSKFIKNKDYRRAKKFQNGDVAKEFNDNGISYETIANRAKCSVSSVSRIVKCGVNNKYFAKKRNIKEISVRNPQLMKKFCDRENKVIIYCKYNILIIGANRYVVLHNNNCTPKK